MHDEDDDDEVDDDDGDACIALWKICRVFRPLLKVGTVSKTEREYMYDDDDDKWL